MTPAPDPSAERATPSTRPGPPSGVPGSGEPASGVVRVVVEAGGRTTESGGIEAIDRAIATPDACVWVDLTGATQETVEAITSRLRLHPLIAEDIAEGNQRAKIEVTDDRIHIVLFAIAYEDETLRLDEIDIVLSERCLLTVHPPGWDPRRIRRVEESLADLLARGPDHLLWALVDAIVDDYFPLMDRVGDAIDDLEDAVVGSADRAALERLFHLKRDLLRVRRAVNPVRDVFNQLTNRDLALIDPAEIVYFRDVYDHLIRLTDEVDTYRELVSGALDVYLSTVNNNLSLIMKRLTGITVVLAGIGAIAGIFGMSEAGPALVGQEARGFWLIAALTVSLAFGLYFLLRRIRWI